MLTDLENTDTARTQEFWRPTESLQVTENSGTPGRIRTCDLLLRRQALYPAELRARNSRWRLHSLGLGPARQPIPLKMTPEPTL